MSQPNDQTAPLLAAPRRKEVDLRLVPMGFGALILVGALLLLLPWAHQPGHSIGWLDALFLSTSATCVTGLTTVNVAETFNGFGQAVLLLLIQARGLGIFTASISLVLLSGNRLSLSDEQTIHATVGRLRQVRPLDVFIDARHATVLEKLGADLVVLPTRDMAYRLAERLRDNAGSDRQELCRDYQMAQIRLGPPLHGRTLAEAGLREPFGVNAVLLTRPAPNGQTEALEPRADLKLAFYDLLFVSGLREKLNKFEHECGLPE